MKYGNPNTKKYCKGCEFYEPVGFYTWEREESPSKCLCKHLKKCNRVYVIASKEEKQMTFI